MGREQEMLQELHSRQVVSATQVHIFGNARDGVYHPHLFVECHPLLTEIAEPHRLAHHKTAAVRHHLPQ